MLTFRKFLLLLAASTASVALSTTTAAAAPIQSFSTSYFGGTAAGANLNYAPNFVGAQNIGSAPNIVGQSVSALTLTLTGVHPAGNGPVTFSPSFNISGTSAAFTFVQPPSLQITGYLGGPPPSFTVMGEVFMSALDTNFGFGDANSLGQIWTFTFTSNGASIINGAPGSFAIGGSSTASATFDATTRRFNLTEVPEPATLATLGLVGLVGGATVRRRMKNAMATA